MPTLEKNNNDRITIKGLIIPVDWNPSGEPVGVSISTYNEIDYLVDTNEEGRGLLGLLHREVEVKGKVRVLAGGEKVLEVYEYRPTGRPRTGRKRSLVSREE